MGPILEWRQETGRSAAMSGVLAALLVAALPTVEGYGLWWTSLWWWWLIVLLPGILIYLVMRGGWLAAGARWAQNQNKWVDVYDLTLVQVRASGVNMMLRLKDSGGRDIGSLKLKDIQRNQNLWDLVYCGILHSVASGKANPPANVRTILKLPGGQRAHRDGS
jgi:hypothetical protein